ncbi:hypothetical protein LINPERHAP1_LOCUS23746 [Linum perenne]
MTRTTNTTTVTNAATTAPLTFWQKSPNCWQIASQFVLLFPLCASLQCQERGGGSGERRRGDEQWRGWRKVGIVRGILPLSPLLSRRTCNFISPPNQ